MHMYTHMLTRPQVRLRLGLLPSRDSSVPRTANIIKPASHQIWKLRSAKALQDYLAASFPQVYPPQVEDMHIDPGHVCMYV